VPYDCLLLDISMPGMNGIELCKAIRDIPSYRSTPIVMLTGMRDMKSMDSAFQAGASDYITKPFDVIELGARLRLVQKTTSLEIERTISAVAEKSQTSFVAHSEVIGSFDELVLLGPKSLVEQKTLASYMSLLSSTDAARTHVWVAKIDRVDTISAKAKFVHYDEVLRDVAIALDEVFGSNQMAMAYAGGGTFLIASIPVANRSSAALETDLNERLASLDTRYISSPAIRVSVGRPVQPRGTKEQRSGSSFGRAIALANSRSLEKQGGATSDAYRLVG
jgi:PleD family two-component response regulator